MRKIERLIGRKPKEDPNVFEFEGLMVDIDDNPPYIYFTDENKPTFLPDGEVVGYIHFNPLKEEIPKSHPEDSFRVLRQGYRSLEKFITDIELGKYPRPTFLVGHTSPEMGKLGVRLGMEDVTRRNREYAQEQSLDRTSESLIWELMIWLYTEGWMDLFLLFIPPHSRKKEFPDHFPSLKLLDKSNNSIQELYFTYQVLEKMGRKGVSELFRVKLTEKQYEDGLDMFAASFGVDFLHAELGVILECEYDAFLKNFLKIAQSPLGRRLQTR